MSKPPESTQLDDVLKTEELLCRSPRQPNLQAENQAMRSLAWQLAHEPDQMLQRLVDSAQELCNAGTAGVSLIETSPNGEEVFRWGALAGALAAHVGGCVSRHFSPCGVCLEQGAPVLFAYPERYFTDLQQANLPMPEMLVLPLVVADHALGTLWLVTHHEQRQFDSEDVRLMAGLADFTAATLRRSQQQAQKLLRAGTALQQESAERKLAEEQALALVENLPGGAAFIVDRDLRYVMAAGEALAIAGFKPQDFIGRTMSAVLPPALAASYAPLYHQALAGEPFEHEHQAHNRWYISRGTPLPDDDGKIYAVLAVSYDVTERKQAEADLRKSEEQLRLFVAASSDVVYRMSADWQEMHQLDSQDFLRSTEQPSQSWIETYIPPEEQPRVWAAIREAIQTRSVFELEHQVIQQDGTIGWTFSRAIPRLNGQGEILDWLGTARDVTDQKQAAAKLVTDLRDTQLLQELSARLISEADIQVLYDEILATAIALSRADAGSFQCFDIAKDELNLLTTRGFSQTMVEHFDRIRASSHTSCGQAIAQGQRAFVDFDAPNDPDGSLKMHLDAGLLSAQSTPLISRSGQVIGMVSTHWRRHHRPGDRELRFLDLLARQAADLIEQRQAELERRQLLEREQAARAEAERANRVKDEFLAILSHELRSPLNPILGWSKLLQTQKLDAEKTQRALSTIERNAKLQTQLIDDLLDVARILRGKLKIEAAPVNLAVVIEAALDVVSHSAEAKGIALQFDLIEVCEVNGDEGRLQQVVWNLLTNAIKFTPAGGQVRVRLEQVSEVGGVGGAGGVGGRAIISPTSPTSPTLPQYARITVTDTGKGIQRDFLPHLFQAFHQEDVSISRQYGGLGLGLSIVKYLVDAHGGTVTANSPGEGQGATFIVQLPLRQEQPIPPSTAPSASDIRDLDGIRVLAVDDSDDARELLAMVLTQYGAEVKLAASGPEVLDRLANAQPDVLVCDIGMPNMNGYDLIRRIRALPDAQGGNVPAIAVTAFAHEEDRQRALNHGFQEHIAKPIEPEQVVNAIAQLARR